MVGRGSPLPAVARGEMFARQRPLDGAPGVPRPTNDRADFQSNGAMTPRGRKTMENCKPLYKFRAGRFNCPDESKSIGKNRNQTNNERNQIPNPTSGQTMVKHAGWSI